MLHDEEVWISRRELDLALVASARPGSQNDMLHLELMCSTQDHLCIPRSGRDQVTEGRRQPT
jgi:hypothetical protein